MKDIIFLVVIPLALCVFISIIFSTYFKERDGRIIAEQELTTTRNALKNVCEKCINEKSYMPAQITYQVYFGQEVDHSGDGFIDGYE